jgi:hypothetical protein
MGETAPLPRREPSDEGATSKPRVLSVLERVDLFTARVPATISPPFINGTESWLVIIRGVEENFSGGVQMMDELENRYPAPSKIEIEPQPASY